MDNLLENRNDLMDWKREVLRNLRRAAPSPERLERSGELGRRDFLRAAAAGAGALAGMRAGGRIAGMHGMHGITETASSGLKKEKTSPVSPESLRPSRSSKPAGKEPPKAVKTGTFFFPRVMFHVRDETGDQWNIYPVGDVILRKRLKQLTNVNASEDPVVVRLADLDSTCRYPFVFATSEGYFDLPDNEKKNLKEFLMRGGFVYADDCVLGKTGDRFFRDYVKMINRMFEKERIEMKRVPDDHEINHCYFRFPKGAPFIQGVNHGAHALFEKGTGRIMTYLTAGDLHCGWTCMWNTREQCEATLKMGINIIIYYLTH